MVDNPEMLTIPRCKWAQVRADASSQNSIKTAAGEVLCIFSEQIAACAPPADEREPGAFHVLPYGRMPGPRWRDRSEVEPGVW